MCKLLINNVFIKDKPSCGYLCSIGYESTCYCRFENFYRTAINFKFLDSFFQYLDSGKLYRQPFRILYYIIGVLGCGGSLYYLSDVFDFVSMFKGIAYVYAILMVVVCLAAAVFTLIYWFRRASEMDKNVNENTRFYSLPVVGAFIRSFSEWFGIVVAGVGASAGILTALILPLAVNNGGGEIFKSGLIAAIVAAVIGFLTVTLGRACGEKMIAIGSIDDEVVAKKAK